MRAFSTTEARLLMTDCRFASTVGGFLGSGMSRDARSIAFEVNARGVHAPWEPRPYARPGVELSPVTGRVAASTAIALALVAGPALAAESEAIRLLADPPLRECAHVSRAWVRRTPHPPATRRRAGRASARDEERRRRSRDFFDTGRSARTTCVHKASLAAAQFARA